MELAATGDAKRRPLSRRTSSGKRGSLGLALTTKPMTSQDKPVAKASPWGSKKRYSILLPHELAERFERVAKGEGAGMDALLLTRNSVRAMIRSNRSRTISSG